MTRILKVIVLVVFLSACAVHETGKPINYAKLERLTLGISTQEDAKQVMGYPQAILYPDSRTIYQYRYTRVKGHHTLRQALDLVFNKNQRLIDITINDGLNEDSELEE